MAIIKLLFGFILAIFLSNKDECNPFNYKFNPSKILFIFVFMISIILNTLFITKANKVIAKMKIACPNIVI